MDVDALDEPPRGAPSPMHKPGVRRRGSSSEPESIYADDGEAGPSSRVKRRLDCGPLDHGVPVTNFYGSSSGKGKQNAVTRAPSSRVEQECQVEEVFSSPEPSKATERPMTHIFTLDSLGTKHPQAIKVLKQYLVMEAKDKRGIEACSEAKGKQALVPSQPNFCDCGLYLLHFAETFMKDPDRYCRLILQKGRSPIEERQTNWDEASVGSLRAKLAAKVVELSEQWKRDRAAKEEQKKDISEGKEPDRVESSDDDVDIVEVPDEPFMPVSKGKGKGKGKAPHSKAKAPPSQSKAARVR